MASELIMIGSCNDADGDEVIVFTQGADVFIELTHYYDTEGSAVVKFGAEQREQFQRLFMEAERVAEAIP